MSLTTIEEENIKENLKKMEFYKEQKLEWTTIEFDDEHDLKGQLWESKYTEEAPYRGGFLVKHVCMQYDDKSDRPTMINISMTFVK